MLNFKRFARRFSSLLGLFLSLLAMHLTANADTPIQIRITAVNYDLFRDSAQNAGISLKFSKSGFDVYWTGYSIADSTGGIYAVTPTLHALAGSGSSRVDDPNTNLCTGTFSIDNSSQELFYPTIAKTDGSTVTLQIAGPAKASNSTTDAFLDDRTPGLSSSCKTPIGPSLLGGTGVTGGGSWTPEASLLSNDGLTLRSVYALVQFNTKSLPQTLPFTFHYDASIGTFRSEAVFYGVVTVSEPASVQAVDPFALGGYTPPANPGDDLNPPPLPGNLTPDTPARIGAWLKAFIGPLDKALKNSFIQAQSAAKTGAASSIGSGNYDAENSSFTFSGYPETLASGEVLDFGIVMRSPNNAPVNLKPAVPKGAIQNQLLAVAPVSVTTKISNSIKKNLKSGKAFTVYVTVRVKPSSGAAIQRTARFSLPLKRKKH